MKIYESGCKYTKVMKMDEGNADGDAAEDGDGVNPLCKKMRFLLPSKSLLCRFVYVYLPTRTYK